MAITLQHLQVRVEAEDGEYGVDVDLRGNLVIIQAENTSGKSTCAMAILYALGLEGMLGPSHAPPLPEAVTDRLRTEDDEVVDVLNSSVRLTVSNDKGEVCTILRSMTGTLKERQRVRVFDGAGMSEAAKARDYFVRTPRAAKSELGFHSFLAKFADINLPELHRFDGEKIPMYLECITPFAFVDQLSGWRDIKARMPTYLQIPDMIQRVIEYVLELDVLARAIRKEELEKEELRLRSKWSHAVEEANASMPRIGFVMRDLPASPPDSPEKVQPNIYLSSQEQWRELPEEEKSLIEKMREYDSLDIPGGGDINDKTLERIRNTEAEFSKAEKSLEKLEFSIIGERGQLTSISTRLDALRENLRQYEDEKKLRDRGGIPFSGLDISQSCPVCGSSTKDALVEKSSPITPMLLEENIDFLRDQIKTFRVLQEEVERTIIGKQQKVIASRQRLKDVAESLRAEKEQLREGRGSPSVVAVRERLQAQSRLDAVASLRQNFDVLVVTLNGIHKSYLQVLEELKGVKGQGLSDNDRRKLDLLGQSYLRQLGDYGFSSYPLEEIGVNKETYRPSHLGYDLGLTSASDSIRSIWAYLLAMLETSYSENGNHLGFLLLDEPRQQMVKDLSHEALIRQSERVASIGAQVVVFTSQERSELQQIVGSVEAKLIELDKWIIRRLPA